MSKFNKTISLVILTGFLASAFGAGNLSAPKVKAENKSTATLPTMTGAAAKKYLAENDLLDSMKDAVEQARTDSAAPQGIFTEVKKVFDPTGVSGDEFGFSVGISGDTAIVGAPFDDTGAMTDQGAAYIFERNTGGANFWGEFQKLTPSDGVAGDRFGGAVAVGENNRVIVGANFADINSFSGGNAGVNSPLAGADQGAVYIFQGNLLAPTAASASISGRVTTARGRGISGAAVTLVGGNLTQPIRARTTSFGYFRFDDVPVGATYFLSVSAKRFTFANSSMVLNLHEEFTEANFVAEE